MKKILLLAAAALMVTSANAQIKRSETTSIPARPHLQLMKPEAKMEVAQKRIPGMPVFKAPKKAGNVDVWYHRPAGAFPASLVVEDGTYAGVMYAPYISVTPYVDYTFHGFADGESPDASFEWDVQYWRMTEDGTDSEQVWETVVSHDLTMQYGYETDSVPFLYVVDPDGSYEFFNLRGFEMGGSSGAPTIVAEHCSDILSVPSTMEIWDTDFLKSSKNFCYGGLYGNQRYPFTYYSGAEPYGSNENGWWFGKNGYHQVASPRYFVDGIAQAFEKPTAPYLLNQVVLDCAILEVAAQVDMTCRIYKLDEIPAYNDTAEVALPEEPGELIAMGRATLTPETEATTGGLVFFTLFGEEDGLVYDITPTIDCAILVVIDGYNDPEMENLTDFSALIASDDETDEGFGELAYLKFGYAEEDGSASYYWAGLNNFFSSGAMKTGFSIFLSTENPYLTFNYNAEDGEYTFPAEGGLMEKHFGSYTTRSIEFWAWTASADDAWYLSCNDDEVPEWLSIELTDIMQGGEFTGLVNAEVYAEPLPEGMPYREAVVRFEFPGAYLDYTFKQGTPQEFEKADVNRDHEVNIADVNYLISMILSGNPSDLGDVNGDGEINIADINAVIDRILRGHR